ncbi:hypothetical protein [Empedobacter falsenii]
MTVKELKEQIENLPDDLEIFIDTWSVDDNYRYSLTNEIEVKEIHFCEDEECIEQAEQTVLIIECV